MNDSTILIELALGTLFAGIGALIIFLGFVLLKLSFALFYDVWRLGLPL